MWSKIASQISQVTGQSFAPSHDRAVGGGCINRGYALSDGDRHFFVKLNQAGYVAMFEAEAAGLLDIGKTNTIRVPQPICWGVDRKASYLVLEWLEMGPGTAAGWRAMGRRLAQLHQVTSSCGFGWQRPNTIGLTPQINPWTDSWAEFWTQSRLSYQLQLARRRGGRLDLGDRLLAIVPELLAGHDPAPALVHGDLWSGNAAITQAGEPVIFDPAMYYGDREVDLAMTELFGGFPPEFYRGYYAVLPRVAGYSVRKELYNLYHILNHFNLFEGSYEEQANRIMANLIALVS
jgi:fructosamine-3-kinase